MLLTWGTSGAACDKGDHTTQTGVRWHMPFWEYLCHEYLLSKLLDASFKSHKQNPMEFCASFKFHKDQEGSQNQYSAYTSMQQPSPDKKFSLWSRFFWFNECEKTAVLLHELESDFLGLHYYYYYLCAFNIIFKRENCHPQVSQHLDMKAYAFDMFNITIVKLEKMKS